VSTIHDLSPFLLPNYGSERTLRNTQQRYREAGEISDRVIAVSQATKDDYLRLLPIPAERIHVVYHGVSAAFLAQDTTAPGAASRTGPPYLVAFGGNPRKNLARALEAFARSELRGSLEIRVLGSLDAAASEAVRRNRLEDAVRLAPEHDDAGMAQLYRGSVGLIFPSLMEGFGLPLLEAMASGVPVLTSARAGTAEIAGGHALLVDPESIDDIAAGMGRMPSVSRDALTAAASYARTFTWRRTAEQTLAVYRALAG
jgi:glycosyltransferase involved in cell wall biosynthesis